MRATRTPQSGQAALETALTLPMHIFVMLGILQLTLAYHAKLLTEYAVFKAVRAGSVYRVDCQRMVDAAVIALGPTLPSAGGADPATKLTAAIHKALYVDKNQSPANTPRVLVQYYLDGPTNQSFDTQLSLGQSPLLLHARLAYFFDYRVPFANWILSRVWLSMNTGMAWTSGVDPTNPVVANAHQPSYQQFFDQEILNYARININDNSYYAPPVVATWTMRMMSDPLPNKTGKNPYHTCKCVNDNPCSDQ